MGRDVEDEHIIFDVWEWHKGAENQQVLVSDMTLVCVSRDSLACGHVDMCEMNCLNAVCGMTDTTRQLRELICDVTHSYRNDSFMCACWETSTRQRVGKLQHVNSESTCVT